VLRDEGKYGQAGEMYQQALSLSEDLKSIPIPAGIPVLATVPNVMYSSNSNASPEISPRAPLANSNDSGDGTSSTSSSASLSLEAVSKVFPLSSYFSFVKGCNISLYNHGQSTHSHDQGEQILMTTGSRGQGRPGH
jgi:hypothetical protein